MCGMRRRVRLPLCVRSKVKIYLTHAVFPEQIYYVVMLAADVLDVFTSLSHTHTHEAFLVSHHVLLPPFVGGNYCRAGKQIEDNLYGRRHAWTRGI